MHVCVYVHMYACVSEVLGTEIEHDPRLLCISELQTLVFVVVMMVVVVVVCVRACVHVCVHVCV